MTSRNCLTEQLRLLRFVFGDAMEQKQRPD